MYVREMIRKNVSLQIAYTGLMIAFVFLTTIVFSLYIPATKGFFNIGEAGVYIAAITGGPLVGLMAGGFGSMFADLFLNYPQYAPGTLVIKGLEGLIVGYLSTALEKKFISEVNKIMGLVIGVVISIGVALLGNIFYLGEAEISVGIPGTQYLINITSFVWYALGIILFIIVIALGYKYPEELGYIIAMICGGVEMIVGYFLYEAIILGVAAYVEILYNAMQMTIGILIALLVVSFLKKAY